MGKTQYERNEAVPTFAGSVYVHLLGIETAVWPDDQDVAHGDLDEV